jgi:short-subunit dehydrogenase
VVHPADVAEPDQLRNLVDRFGSAWLPLAGVIHAAGTLADGMIGEQTPERFDEVFRAKVAGAIQLDQATRQCSLDFLVYFSSIAAVLGSAGQTNYAAANAFLDANAQRSRSEGRCVTSINWGPWSEGGMASHSAARANLARQGLSPLPLSVGQRAISRVLTTGAANVVVLDVDWASMSRYFGENRPKMLQQLLLAPAEKHTVMEELRRVTHFAEAREILTNHLIAQVAQVLMLPEVSAVDPTRGFSEIGMDSLTAVEFRNRLQGSLECSLPVTIVFDCGTVVDMANHLLSNVLSLRLEADESESTQGPELDDLDEDEMAVLLAKKLSQID